MLAVPSISPVVVVLGAHAAEVQEAVDLSGTDVVVCEQWADGQSASLQAGVAALGEVEAAVITLGDQPFISAEVIAGVLDHRGRHLAVRATYDGDPGHPVLLERRLLDHVSELDGDTGARDAARGRPRVHMGGRAAVRPDRHRHARAAPGGPVMKLEQSFEVAAPIDQVWAALNDLERVAPCLPGAAITDHDDDGTYHGTFQVKLGPTTASYRGTIKIESADESTHTATLKARGTDKRGQGGASATIVNTLSEHDGGTTVEAVTDFSITGRLARFGRGGMMEDISNRMMRDFATCLSSRLADAPTAPSGEEIAKGEAPPEAAAAAAPQEGADTEAAARGADTPPPPPPPPPAAAKPVGGIGLFFSVLWERISAPLRAGSRIELIPAMEQRLSLVTLGVADVPAARAFYEALGWTCDTDPALDVAFFQLGGIALAVWDRKQLAEDSTVTDRGGFGGVTLAYNVRSAEEVDAALAEAEAAGATIGRPGAKTFWGGYSGVFVDPDGHPGRSPTTRTGRSRPTGRCGSSRYRPAARAAPR